MFYKVLICTDENIYFSALWILQLIALILCVTTVNFISDFRYTHYILYYEILAIQSPSSIEMSDFFSLWQTCYCEK